MLYFNSFFSSKITLYRTFEVSFVSYEMSQVCMANIAHDIKEDYKSKTLSKELSYTVNAKNVDFM